MTTRHMRDERKTHGTANSKFRNSESFNMFNPMFRVVDDYEIHGDIQVTKSSKVGDFAQHTTQTEQITYQITHLFQSFHYLCTYLTYNL